MIGGIKDYNETEVKDFGPVEKIELGGHICKIYDVEIETFTSKKDGKEYSSLKLKFDMVDPDPQAGFYQRKFADAAKKDAMNAKWKGYHKVSIPTNESEDFIKSSWKGFLTSIENSNPGTKLDGVNGFDEKLLIGKIFGGVFGLEELTLPDGKLITFARIRFVRSTDKVNEAPIPKVKLLDGTYMDYEEYIQKEDKELENAGKALEETATIGDQDDLPF